MTAKTNPELIKKLIQDEYSPTAGKCMNMFANELDDDRMYEEIYVNGKRFIIPVYLDAEDEHYGIFHRNEEITYDGHPANCKLCEN